MVELLVGSMSQRDQNELQQRIAIGTVDIVVGTQALLSNKIEFHSLGLVVIDEQHNFGVAQRAALKESRIVPHYLVLSATPIPTQYCDDQFGDLDVSIIKTNHQVVLRRIRTLARRRSKRVGGLCSKTIICWQAGLCHSARVEQDSESESLGAEQTFLQLKTTSLLIFESGFSTVEWMERKNKDVSPNLIRGDIQLLVATTVVEVGIDVPNATIMTILDADRLGLAQLHQLRGRVSRGGTPGYVCVFPRAGVDASENERLKIFASTEDGFQLAEEDLKLRGWGDLLGVKQVGSASLRIADLARDAEILSVAREIARSIVARDPGWRILP